MAYYDESENIVALIARPDEAPPSEIDLGRPGLRKIDVEATELTNDLDLNQVHEHLAALISTQRIESASPAARLVARS
ncbi:hypothetical protein [Actinoplanes sp. NBRC 103695]|uniref:hypothetical protein n=1 Tax=Actinoplanes sp. NBRC 103695 TaxID=3032202 RepID=UPI002556E619|nr:hypothetical protein [Actinoplanes sp. NBRC 103695]